LSNVYIFDPLILLKTETKTETILKFHRIHSDKLHEEEPKILTETAGTDCNHDKIIHLLPYTNRSSVALPETFSLHRAYLLLR
jgi:hypothetical protein